MVTCQLTVRRDGIAITGDIQPGLRGLFQQHWDTVKNYTAESEDDGDILEVYYPLHENHRYFVCITYGGGYKPYFSIDVSTPDELKTVVKYIFAVDL